MKKYILIIFSVALFACGTASNDRQVINLNGEWQVAKTDGELPSEYLSVAPVPGLVDLAVPALDTIVVEPVDAANTHSRPSYGYKDGWYWHRRTFEIADASADVVRLKIFKAKYHTKVYVNGQFAGENYYCFTPSYFDIKPFLKAGLNEIIIGVGCKEQLPDTIPNGGDFEKQRYIPGIYDNVEITVSGKPFIRNVQCAPDIKNMRLRVTSEIESDKPDGWRINYAITEKSTGQTVASGKTKNIKPGDDCYIADFEIDMTDATLWTPETPFLYELNLETGADAKTTTFGMRSFRFDTEKKIALLNEEPYYLRGTNVCIFRFFEDPDRASLPWDASWSRKLHERFKDMHWEMARYCIGFPPEQWYDICDSIGFMIQDEFPVWVSYDKLPENMQPKHLAEEYRRWMRERWNHPSVVIWDGQNESVDDKLAVAINSVRRLDLSDRPWENGWSAPAAATDVCESHPYLFSSYMGGRKEPPGGYRKELFDAIRRPDNSASEHYGRRHNIAENYPNPLLINEYGWIWLNRNGTTTTLTDKVYETLWNGDKLTPEERLHIYGRHLAMLTEYWRAHRLAAGVLHFCGLAYSRPEPPRGQTSDHWIDIKNLTFEPNFYKYVKSSFAPVGLMIDLWEKSYSPSANVKVDVFVINDLKAPYNQDITLSIEKDGKVLSETKQSVEIKGYEVKVVGFDVKLPSEPGDYIMKAEIIETGEKVASLRDIFIK